MSDYSANLFGEAVSEEEEISEAVSVAARSSFNIFLLTDAIGARRRRDAWVLYERALFEGMIAEEIFWRVVWIVKSMILASRTSSCKETDMKEFPYRKAKEFSKNFKKEELEKLSEELVVGYHQARRGAGEIETLLEKLILNL